MGNILFRLSKATNALSVDQLYEQYGQPECEPIVRFDKCPLPQGVPTRNVVPVWMGKGSDNIILDEVGILFIDFGEPFLPSITSRYDSKTPMLLAPPEIYFEPSKPVSFPIDIWSLACTVYNIIGGRPPFEGFVLLPTG